jgi:CheY-like chemotaxis protein
MTVTCSKCHASLNIPDDRLPRGKVVNAACPRCGGPVAIDMTKAAAPTAPAAPGRPDALAKPPAESISYGERNQPRALVCITDPAEERQILASLREAGYAAHAVSNPSEAVERVRFAEYAVVVLREGFDGPAGSAASLAEVLTDTPMGTRRNTHTVFVGPSVTTHDSEAAFVKSVDLTIHPNDLAHFSDALKRSVAETEQMYRVFREIQRALGKR